MVPHKKARFSYKPMKLRFARHRINELASQYDAELGERDRRLTGGITEQVFPSYRRKGYLTKGEFTKVCAWKTPRTRKRCELNDERMVREISALVRRTRSEHMRILPWTLLSGVQMPTASVFLHFAFPNRYPIVDYRALWSLQTDVPSQYTFAFWWEYTQFCRKLAREAIVSMRVLDKALWKYSELNQ